MITLHLVGIGSGNTDHLTLQAVKTLNNVDLILIPRKGEAKEQLAHIRMDICREILHNGRVKIAEFHYPERDDSERNYFKRVEDWHDVICNRWHETIITNIGQSGHVALLVWGDPSLYDSTLRIAHKLEQKLELSVNVVPGITSIQALTASHRQPFNDIDAAVLVTTGRQLRDNGWPGNVDRIVVMLDGQCSFQFLEGDYHIWWSAYAGMEQEINYSGNLKEISEKIITARKEARERYGWIMDIYMLQRFK